MRKLKTKMKSRVITEAAKVKLRATRAARREVPAITLKMLRKMDACSAERRLFVKTFGKAASVQLTPANLAIALMAGLNIRWLLERMGIRSVNTAEKLIWEQVLGVKTFDPREMTKDTAVSDELYEIKQLYARMLDARSIARGLKTVGGRRMMRERLARW